MQLHYAKSFAKAMMEGYGKHTADYNAADTKMIEKLRTSVYQFSAAKTYTQMKALTGALVNDDNKLRTFSEFRTAAAEVTDLFVSTWQRSEYNLAVASSQMASKWADITANGEEVLMEFEAVMDGSTTEICEPLNGTILPANDSFWNINYPPNHFNCRSSVTEAVGSKTATAKGSVPGVDIPKMFQTNLAKDGLVFPKGSAYYKDCPKSILNNAENIDDE